MDNITVRERAVLHLSRFPEMGPKDIFNVPFDLTQDGIASVLGISRAHVSLELKKLKETGKVCDWQAHVRGGNSKRRAYCLLPEGFADAEMLRKRVESSGLIVDSLLDMKMCDPGVMWGSLNTRDRETFGLACVFRVPVPRKTLDDTETGVVPTDFYGNVRISDQVRKKYLSVVDPEKVRTWHSRAADWWMDNGNDDQERLFHLVCSGRSTEACKLLLRRGDAFLENPNDDLLDILKSLDPVPKHRESVCSIRARVAVACGDADDARLCAEVLDDYGTPEPEIIRAEAALAEGDAEKAFAAASDAFMVHGLSRAAIAAADALFRMGRYDEADSFIGSAYETLSDGVEAARMDELMFLRAGIAYRRGKADNALSYLNKAQRICRRPLMKERILSVSASIRDGKDPRF